MLTFHAGAFEVARSQFWRLRAQAVKLLGTWLDGDIIDLGLIDAEVRCGHYALAVHIANERVERRPGSAFEWDLLNRVADAQRVAAREEQEVLDSALVTAALDICGLQLVANQAA